MHARRPDFHQCARFLIESRPEIFSTWPFERIRQWLAYHWNQRGLSVVVEGDTVVGLAVGWRAQLPDIDDPWSRWDESGDTLWISQLHARTPEAMGALLISLQARVPDWDAIAVHGMRRGKRVRFPDGYLRRLFQITAQRLTHC